MAVLLTSVLVKKKAQAATDLLQNELVKGNPHRFLAAPGLC
jgi:hypothetical protein